MCTTNNKTTNQGAQLARYQRLLESTHAIPWELNLSTWCFTYVGPQVEKIFGYTQKEWQQENFWVDHIHPDDRGWAPRFCQQSTSRGEDHEFEYRMLCADGRVIWVRDIVNVISGDTGPIALHGFMFDITQRKQAEQVLKTLAGTGSMGDVSAFMRLCAHNLAHVYDARYAFVGLIVGEGKRVRTAAVWAGDDFAENFEYDLEGTPCKDILDQTEELIPTAASTIYEHDEMLVQMGIDSYFGAPLVDSKGTTIGLVSVMDSKPMELHRWSAPILGVFASRIAVELERSEVMEQLQELNATLENRVEERTRALRISNTELESFSYSVSHDLRAPLRAIDGFSRALEEDCAAVLDDNGLEFLRRIRNNANHMAELIDGLLQLSRINQHALEREPLSLGAVADRCMKRLCDAEPERKVRFINTHRATVRGDKTLLSIVMDNLLSNAWKYSSKEADPEIEFGCKTQGGRIVHYVRDNGVGFNMEYSDKLFGTFQRLHRVDEFPGTGIGLATVQRILQRHNGDIWAESHPGEGSTFFFTLGT